jgi:hypothetical protein
MTTIVKIIIAVGSVAAIGGLAYYFYKKAGKANPISLPGNQAGSNNSNKPYVGTGAKIEKIVAGGVKVKEGNKQVKEKGGLGSL